MGSESDDEKSTFWRTLGRVSTVAGALGIFSAVFVFWDTVCERFPGMAGVLPFVTCKQARVPSRPVTVTGPDTSKAPVPRAVVRQEQFKQFSVAFKDRDQAHLDYLYQAGFRLENGCGLWGQGIGAPTYKSAHEAQWAVGVMLKFTPHAFSCGNKPFDAHVITLWRIGLRSSSHSNSGWSDTSLILDAWISAKGASSEFRAVAKEILTDIRQLSRVTRVDFVEACAIAHDANSPENPESADSVASKMLYRTGACPFRVDHSPYVMRDRIVSAQMRGRLSREFPNENARKAFDLGIAKALCDKEIRKSDFCLPPPDVERALVRWAQ